MVSRMMLTLAGVFALSAVGARATVITFDDLTDNGSGTPIADGYSGLDWSGIYVLNTVD